MTGPDLPATRAARAVLGAAAALGVALCLLGPPRWEWLAARQTPRQRVAAEEVRREGVTPLRAAAALALCGGAVLAALPPAALDRFAQRRRPAGTPAGRVWAVLSAPVFRRRSTRA